MSVYSDPALWEQAKAEARKRMGGHSARAMQLAGRLYRAAGGKYLGKRTKAQKSLEQWTDQDWTTKSGKPSRQTGERYLPRKVIEKLTPAEYGATTRAKRKGTAAGQQFVKQPARIAAKVARLKGNPTMKKPTPAQLAARARFAEMARSGAFKKKAATKRKKNPVEGGKFQVGKYYETRSIGDANMKIGATILARTDKSVTVKGTDSMMKSSYRLTKDYNGNEMFYPWGRYSMAPMIGADDEKPKTNPAKKTVGEKISQLMREGYPQKQAIAIALNEERAGKVKRNPRATNPATGTKKSRTKLNPKPRMAKIAFATRGGQTETIEVPIDFAFKEYIGNIQQDFFARKQKTKGVPFDALVVSEKSTGYKVGVVPRTLRSVFGDRAAAKQFVQDLAQQVGAEKFNAQIALKPKIA